MTSIQDVVIFVQLMINTTTNPSTRDSGTIQEEPVLLKDVLDRDLQHDQSILQRTVAKTGSEGSK
ncbi:20863_t:CDS:2 [Gigaspora rosea]|nr:20863_t:CDS:2 [Gigaspora rosea]